jgi:hypothetical protein
MTKIAGSESGSISQRHGSADPDPDSDPTQNVMDPQHCRKLFLSAASLSNCSERASISTVPYCMFDSVRCGAEEACRLQATTPTTPHSITQPEAWPAHEPTGPSSEVRDRIE